MSIKGNWRRHGSEVVIGWCQRFFSRPFATLLRRFAAQFCRPQREKNLWHPGYLVIKPGKKQSVSERNSGKVLFLIWRVFFHVPAKAEKSFFEEVKKSEGGKSCLTLGCYCRVVYCRLFWGWGGLYFCLELCVNVIWKQQKKKKKRKQENKKYAILL